MKIADGWRGDRFIEEGKGTVWMIAFSNAADAADCAEALFQEEFHSLRGGLGQITKNANGQQSTVTSVKGGWTMTIEQRAARVTVYTAPDQSTCRTLSDKYGGALALQIYSAKEKREISFGELTDRLLETDTICVGESHDSDLHHRIQLQIIQSLFVRDPRLGIGMEMFQRPFQVWLDGYLDGTMKSEERFLKMTDYPTRWGYEWSMYRPIVDFCRANGVPVAALNVATELKNRISKVGHAKLTDDEKKELGDVDFDVKAHRDYFIDLLAKMHGKDATAEQKERSYQVMTVWDEYMADSAAKFQKERGIRRMVILAGSGHIERGFGIPDRMTKRTGGKTATIKIEVGGDLEKLTKEPTTDYLIVVR